MTDLSNVTLFCPASSVDLYRNAHGWNQCKSFQPIEALDEYILTDSDNYTQTVDFETKKFEYSRIYKNTNWQTIILPVSLDYEDFCEDFEIAKIYNIIVTQSVEGGDLGDASIQIVKLKEGDYTVPNVPYMIKAKVEDSENAQVISKENCVVYRANPQSLECSNTETAFTFTGTYSAISADDLAGYYAMSGGSWYHQTGAAGLKPMRAYMSISSKTGGYNSIVANHAPLRVSVVGEEEAGEVSAIITLTADTNADEGIIIDRQLIGLPAGSYSLTSKCFFRLQEDLIRSQSRRVQIDCLSEIPESISKRQSFVISGYGLRNENITSPQPSYRPTGTFPAGGRCSDGSP